MVDAAADTDWTIIQMNADLIELMLDTPGLDVAHVRYVHHLCAWQASIFWCSHGGTPLMERACCPPRRNKKLAMDDARATTLPIK
jgi:hypothetical protein